MLLLDIGTFRLIFVATMACGLPLFVMIYIHNEFLGARLLLDDGHDDTAVCWPGGTGCAGPGDARARAPGR